MCIRNGVVFSPDSDSYIAQSSTRIGLYPLTILLFQNIFKEYALQTLVVFQITFAIGVSCSLANVMKSTFNLPPMMHWILNFLFISPLLIWKSANDIMSEGLAYPLFLLSSYFLLKGISQKKIQDLCTFSFSIFLLSFTRQQYLFFYGIGLFSFLFLLFFAKDFQKKGTFFLSIILSLGSFFMVERAYHFIFHESFSQTPFTGSHLIIRPLYLATEESYKDFVDPKQRQLVKETVEEIIEKNIIDKEPHKREVDQYTLSFTPIATVFVTLRSKIWPAKSFNGEDTQSDSHFKYLQEIDQQTISMSLTLIKNNFFNYLKSYIKDVIRGFGGYIFFFFVLLMSILHFWNILWNNKINIMYVYFIFSMLMHLGNLTIICLLEPPLTRYTYSTSVLLISMLLIMEYQYIREKNSNEAETDR
jgi:hypothetical protein